MTISASGFTISSSFAGDGSGLTGVPANDWDGSHTGDGVISGKLEVQGDLSGSATSTGSWGKVEATKISGDGSGITGITGEWDGSHTGTATFTGNVTASGVVSASGGFVGDGSNLTGVTAEWDGSHTGTAAFTGNVTASGVVSASGGFVGDGSNLTGLTGGIFVETGSIQAYTGDVHITGSVKIGDPGSSTVNDAGDHIVNYSTYKFFEPQLPSGDGSYTHTLSTGDRQSSAIAWEGYSGVSVTDNNGWNGTTDGGTYGFRARNDGTQVGNYAILDMGASYYISEIKMHEKGNGSTNGVNNGNWKWQGSNDNSNWTDIGPAQNVTSSYANQTGITTAITSPGTYRYYKWIATVAGTAYQSAPVSFYELDFKIKGSDPVMTRVLEVGDGGTVSGSSTSTGSFGRLEGDGSGIAGVTDAAALPKAGGAMTGAITTNSTFDGVDIATRDAILTSTTTTADAALPKAGGTMTGELIGTSATFTGDITANQYIVSSSVTYMTTSFSSGSTTFGDTADDTHKFIGSVTASGVVSASGGFVGDGSNLTSLPGPATLLSVGNVTQVNNPNVASASRWSSNSAAYFSKTYDASTALVFGKGGSNQFGWPTSSAHYPDEGNGFTKDNLSAGDVFTLRVNSVGSNDYITVNNVTYDLKILSVHGNIIDGTWGSWYSASIDSTYGDASAVMALDGTIGGGGANECGYVLKAEATKLAVTDRDFLTYNSTTSAWEPQRHISGSSTSTGSFGRLEGDGSGITGLTTADGFDYTTSSDPLTSTNPSSLGATWINTTSGEIFVATSISAGSNTWKGTDGTTVEPALFYGSRGVFAGGQNTYNSGVNTIDYITIASTGNATDFGDLNTTSYGYGGCSNGSRGVIAGCQSNNIDYITISTPGNATDFGDLTTTKKYLASCSNGIRGIWGGGTPATTATNTIEYVTIASTGNATDYADLTAAKKALAALSDGTKGVFGGGTPTSWSYLNNMDYLTIATGGSAADFGDLTVARRWLGATGNTTRGLFAGGDTGSDSNVIDYITTATTGNATDFGNLSLARKSAAGCTNGTRACFGGDGDNPKTCIDYVTIASTGNAFDFGDLSVGRETLAALAGS